MSPEAASRGYGSKVEHDNSRPFTLLVAEILQQTAVDTVYVLATSSNKCRGDSCIVPNVFATGETLTRSIWVVITGRLEAKAFAVCTMRRKHTSRVKLAVIEIARPNFSCLFCDFVSSNKSFLSTRLSRLRRRQRCTT